MAKVTQQEAIDQLNKTMKTEYKGAKLLQFGMEEVGDNQVVRALVSSPLGTKAEIIEITVTKTEIGPTTQPGQAPTDSAGVVSN